MNFIKRYSIIIIILFVFFMFFKPIVCGFIVGILIFHYGIDSFLFLNYITKSGIESIGKIQSYESDDEGYKTPIIEFKTLEKQLITAKPYYYASSDLSKFRTYKSNIDKNIAVLYSAENPEKFVIKTEKEFNYGTLVFAMVVGFLFIVIAIANLLGFINMDN
jgi:hypothetical protein